MELFPLRPKQYTLFIPKQSLSYTKKSSNKTKINQENELKLPLRTKEHVKCVRKIFKNIKFASILQRIALNNRKTSSMTKFHENHVPYGTGGHNMRNPITLTKQTRQKRELQFVGIFFFNGVVASPHWSTQATKKNNENMTEMYERLQQAVINDHCNLFDFHKDIQALPSILTKTIKIENLSSMGQ